VWDGLPAHRGQAMCAWLRRQRPWLVVEPLPAYAPDLNPVEPLWVNPEGVELANLAGESLEEVVAAAEGGIARIRTTHHLASSFLRYCGLCLWWANDHVTGRSEHPSG
jgi:DDE superfamily endonuclease